MTDKKSSKENLEFWASAALVLGGFTAASLGLDKGLEVCSDVKDAVSDYMRKDAEPLPPQ